MGSGKDKSVAYDVFPSPVLDQHKNRDVCAQISRGLRLGCVLPGDVE